MSFNPLAAKVVSSLIDEFCDNGSVVELGNQTFTATNEVLEEIIEKLKTTKNKRIKLEDIWQIYRKSPKDRGPDTEKFYKALGFETYTTIDVNQTYGSLMMDLNHDLKSKYDFTQTFDLVTNICTGEHIFNQFAVFKNMHDLTKVGGLMLHIMPFVNWINHGFFNFHPTLYADVSAANQYELINLSFANRWGFEVKANGLNQSEATKTYKNKLGQLFSKIMYRFAPGSTHFNRLQKLILKLNRKADFQSTSFSLNEALLQIMPGSLGNQSSLGRALRAVVSNERRRSGSEFANIHIVAVMKKTRNTDFCVPIQNMYADIVESDDIKQHYVKQLKGRSSEIPT